MKIKLTPIQNDSLLTSLGEAAKAEETYLIVKDQVIKAQQNRVRIISLIADAHGIDLSEYDTTKMRLEEGCLILSENSRITNED